MAPGVPTQAVYAERIKKAQEAMKQQGIDVLLVGPSSDLVYLIGYDAHLSERLNLLIIRQEGTPDLVVPVLESFLATSCEPNVTLRRWEETESPSELAASLIGDTTGVTLGVSDQLWSTFLLKLQKAMPDGGLDHWSADSGASARDQGSVGAGQPFRGGAADRRGVARVRGKRPDQRSDRSAGDGSTGRHDGKTRYRTLVRDLRKWTELRVAASSHR